MQLYLAGHLAWYESQKRSRVEIHVPQLARLTDLLRDLGIPVAEIAVAVVNGVVVDLQTVRVSDPDRVELFPPVGGGQICDVVVQGALIERDQLPNDPSARASRLTRLRDGDLTGHLREICDEYLTQRHCARTQQSTYR